MNIEFKLPELGENIASGDVVNVLVHEGQVIAANDGVVELETDKAVVEIPCPHAGKIAKILVKKGETVQVGQTLVLVEAEAEAEAAALGATAGPPSATGGSSASAAAGATGGLSAVAAKVSAAEVPLPAGPEARRLARKLGVDLRQVQGTGPRGRITPEDVKAAAAGATTNLQSVPGLSTSAPLPHGLPSLVASPPVPPGEPGQDAWGPVRRERLSRIRQTIAAQMARSAGTIPHVTNFDDADITDLEALRKGVPPGYLGTNVKLTAMPFVMRAVALALRRHPLLNASLDEENQQVVYKQYVNLSVAVDTPRGLVVPAVRNADRMSVAEIARALALLAERARAAQFTVEELRGGTFTVSNLGAVGGTYSTPIINYPEVAILLLGRSRWMPVVREGKIKTRLLLPLSLSYDHRLVDGATAGRFLNEVIEYLQAPGRLLM
jgi:pyruvate dehydrogenase E2 component (dihydrolipoamide acetyltransferase)